MQTVTIDEAATELAHLVDRAAAGEEVVLTRGGQPVARLTAVPRDTEPRKPGSLRGQIRLADDFDAPLPPEIIDAFSGQRSGSASWTVLPTQLPGSLLSWRPIASNRCQ